MQYRQISIAMLTFSKMNIYIYNIYFGVQYIQSLVRNIDSYLVCVSLLLVVSLVYYVTVSVPGTHAGGGGENPLLVVPECFVYIFL